MATKKNGRSASGGWQVENRQRSVRLSLQTAERFLRRVIGELGVGSDSVALCFVTDREMARLNETERVARGISGRYRDLPCRRPAQRPLGWAQPVGRDPRPHPAWHFAPSGI